jgi:hypothetical protein
MTLDDVKPLIAAIVSAPADKNFNPKVRPYAVHSVVSLAPSSNIPNAPVVALDVVLDQHLADAITDTEVATVVVNAIASVVMSDVEIITNSAAVTATIISAVTNSTAPSTADKQAAATEAVVKIIEGALDIYRTEELIQQVAAAVAAN